MGKGGDPSAIMRQREDERNAEIAENRRRVNEIFDGPPITRRGTGERTNVFEDGKKYYDAGGIEQDIQAKRLKYNQDHDAWKAARANPASVAPNISGNYGGRGINPGNVASNNEIARLARAEPEMDSLYTGFDETGGGGGFNDDYYKTISDSYVKFQTPLLEQQIAEARRKLPTGFGTTKSSAYQRQKGFLEKDYGREQVDISDRAQDFSNEHRAEVERNRSDLLGLANSATDQSALASQANSRISALSKPPTFSPIGDLFQKYTNSIGQGAQARQLGQVCGSLNYGADKNSVRTVG